MPSEATDSALVVAVGRWDADAFAEAYRRHAGAMYAVAWRTLRERAAAEDVVQEVFVRLWEQPQRFEAERGSLRTFLLVETQGRCLDLLRSRARRAQREERQARLSPGEPYDLELEIWDLTVAEQVREALATLSSDERRAIDLAYFGRRSYREVADLLGEPEGTVKSRIRSALHKLRTTVSLDGIEAPWMDP